MSVWNFDARTLSNLSSLASIQARFTGAELLLIDKTGVPQGVHTASTNCGLHATVVIRPREEGLYESIASLVPIDRKSGANWIQIIAEDDVFMCLSPSEIDRDLRSSGQTALLLCPTLFAYHQKQLPQVSRRAGELITGPDFVKSLVGGQRFGDVAWHGRVPRNTFEDFFSWTSTLPHRLGHLSSAILWLAICRGEVSWIPEWAMIKDGTNWSGPDETRERIRRNNAITLQDDLDADHDPLLYCLSVIHLLSGEAARNPSLRVWRIALAASLLARFQVVKPPKFADRLTQRIHLTRVFKLSSHGLTFAVRREVDRCCQAAADRLTGKARTFADVLANEITDGPFFRTETP